MCSCLGNNLPSLSHYQVLQQEPSAGLNPSSPWKYMEIHRGISVCPSDPRALVALKARGQDVKYSTKLGRVPHHKERSHP